MYCRNGSEIRFPTGRSTLVKFVKVLSFWALFIFNIINGQVITHSIVYRRPVCHERIRGYFESLISNRRYNINRTARKTCYRELRLIRFALNVYNIIDRFIIRAITRLENNINVEAESRILTNFYREVTLESGIRISGRADTIVSTEAQREVNGTWYFVTYEIYCLSIGIYIIFLVVNKEVINRSSHFNWRTGTWAIVREENIITFFTDIHKFMRHCSTILEQEWTNSDVTATGIGIHCRSRSGTGCALYRYTAVIRVIIRDIVWPVSGIKHNVSNEHTNTRHAICIKANSLAVLNHKILFRIRGLSVEVMRGYRMDISLICSDKWLEDMLAISQLNRS